MIDPSVGSERMMGASLHTITAHVIFITYFNLHKSASDDNVTLSPFNQPSIHSSSTTALLILCMWHLIKLMYGQRFNVSSLQIPLSCTSNILPGISLLYGIMCSDSASLFIITPIIYRHPSVTPPSSEAHHHHRAFIPLATFPPMPCSPSGKCEHYGIGLIYLFTGCKNILNSTQCVHIINAIKQ